MKEEEEVEVWLLVLRARFRPFDRVDFRVCGASAVALVEAAAAEGSAVLEAWREASRDLSESSVLRLDSETGQKGGSSVKEDSDEAMRPSAGPGMEKGWVAPKG